MPDTVQVMPPGTRTAHQSGFEYAPWPTKATRRRGQVIGGRYRIEGRLGTGSTADVFLCADLRLDTLVVVKQLTPTAQANDELLRRFLSEATALGELEHPNIVRFVDFAAQPGERPYLVMEALRGETLAHLLRRRDSLPLDLAAFIVRRAAQGLDYAHSFNIVHRDIKPDNLFLVGPEDAPDDVKIIDFGMAKLPASLGSSGLHTVLGTIEYMAPEQAMADPVDCRTDVYALGILLFRMLTGHLPFDAPNGLDLLTHQLYSPVPPASWIREDLEPALDRLVERATRKHPSNRHQNLAEFLTELEDALGAPHAAALLSRSLCVEPDIYEPQNPEGRRAAATLARRCSMAPAQLRSATASYDSALEPLVSAIHSRPNATDSPLPSVALAARALTKS